MKDINECVSECQQGTFKIFSKMARPIKITHKDEEGLVVTNCVPSKKPREGLLEIISNVNIK